MSTSNWSQQSLEYLYPILPGNTNCAKHVQTLAKQHTLTTHAPQPEPETKQHKTIIDQTAHVPTQPPNCTALEIIYCWPRIVSILCIGQMMLSPPSDFKIAMTRRCSESFIDCRACVGTPCPRTSFFLTYSFNSDDRVGFPPLLVRGFHVTRRFGIKDDTAFSQNMMVELRILGARLCRGGGSGTSNVS